MKKIGARDGNRTRVNGLEGRGNEPLYDTRELSRGFYRKNQVGQFFFDNKYDFGNRER